MKFRILFFTLALLLLGTALSVLHYNTQQQEREYIQTKATQMKGRVEAAVGTLASFSSFVYEQLIADTELTAIMQKAIGADEIEQAELRMSLYNRLLPLYHLMQKYNFRQLHFQLPDNHSFLRMHSPEKFGDYLGDVRHTVRTVNESLRPVMAFEEGRVFNGYRYVYPLFCQGEHVGSVEVSFSMASCIKILERITNNSYIFAVRRSIVVDTVFVEEQERYVDSSFSSEFVFDKEVIPLFDYRGLFTAEKADLDALIKSGENSGFFSVFKNTPYIILANPIKNLLNEDVALLLCITEDGFFQHFATDRCLWTTFIIIIWLVLIVTVGLFLRRHRRFQEQSTTDELTHLPNRASMNLLLSREISRSLRYGFSLSLLMIDIDDFKILNDMHGHLAGDAALRCVSDVMTQSVRASDCTCRWGGEEFLVLLPQTDCESAVIVAEKIREEILYADKSSYRRLTVSIGVAEYQTGQSAQEFIEAADKAMYIAKTRGKNRVCRISDVEPSLDTESSLTASNES